MFLADPVAVVPHRRNHGGRRRLLDLLAAPRPTRCARTIGARSARCRTAAHATRRCRRRQIHRPIPQPVSTVTAPTSPQVDHLVGPALGDDARRRADHDGVGGRRRPRGRVEVRRQRAVGPARVHRREPVAVGRHRGDGERQRRGARHRGQVEHLERRRAGRSSRRCRRGCRAAAPAPPPGSAGRRRRRCRAGRRSRRWPTRRTRRAARRHRPGTTARLATVWPVP